MPRPPGPQQLAIALVGAVGLGVIVVGAISFRNGGSNYQHGGAVGIALATAALIIGGLEGSNVIARLCAFRPLVWVGKVSYGAYLYHWPIYALSGRRWGPLHGHWLGVTQLALSLALAGLSFRFLESPIQRRRFAPTRRGLFRHWAGAIAAAAAVAGILALVNPAAGASRFGATATGLRIPAATAAKPGTVVARTNAVDRPLRVLVTGDSTGLVIANALISYQNAHPKQLQVLDLSLPGCPFTPADQIRNYSGESGQNVSLCRGWQHTFPSQIAAFKPDVSAVFISVMEQTDQRVRRQGLGQPPRSHLPRAPGGRARPSHHDAQRGWYAGRLGGCALRQIPARSPVAQR